MAHIPYGYRIENGHAVPEPEKAKKLNDFIDAYFRGLSIKEAREASGIEPSQSSLLHYLRSGTYAGTEYYPPIVPDGTRERVIEELARRTHPGFSVIPEAIPVHAKFRTAPPGAACEGSAAEAAAAIYDLIIPDEHGGTFMNASDQAMLRAWAGIEDV